MDDEFRLPSQELELVCGRCGDRSVHSIGRVNLDVSEGGKPTFDFISFTGYFRCGKCGGPGPWEIVDRAPIYDLVRRAADGETVPTLGVVPKTVLDGVFIQTPALAEEALLAKVEKEPQVALNQLALAGLYRRIGMWDRAEERYKAALELDPYAGEARLFSYFMARQNADPSVAAGHLLKIVEAFFTGHRPTDLEEADNLATRVVTLLRDTKGPVREKLQDSNTATGAAEVQSFIGYVLGWKGDEERLVEEAANSLIEGEATPPQAFMPAAGVEWGERFPVDLVPSLQEAAQAVSLTPTELRVILVRDDAGGILIPDRSILPLADKETMLEWKAPPLTHLFRGDRKPPADLDRYPEAYVPHFSTIERHLITLFTSLGPRTDQEMEEIFATMRRRPDGRSLNRTHDFVWQIAALLLGAHVVSEAEFEGLFSALARSVATRAERPVSRNYAGFLCSRTE